MPIRRLDDLVEGVDGAAAGAAERPRDVDPVSPPDAIKVDVEGHEAAVLRGAAATLAAHRPLLVVEVHEAERSAGAEAAAAEPVALREWLEARDYAVEEAEDVWICRPGGE